ncbi:glycosyltransferase, partial [Marinobacter daepoensis]|uniref:glycosyltransferase n=1 Tax=Marinobacter daepoensis TaxID=262077 RepID=UPI000404D99A
MDVLIVYPSSGRGLQKDALILDTALQALGHHCSHRKLPPTPRWRSRLSDYRFKALKQYAPRFLEALYYRFRIGLPSRLRKSDPTDLVIHLENIRTSELASGTRHWLIPNQEWFIESRLPYLAFVDRVLCKTRHAIPIFSALHPTSAYLGFTGGEPPQDEPTEKKDYGLFLHVAGNSQFKGTDTVIACWKKHPEWPKLVVVSQHHELPQEHFPNIVIKRNLEDSELEALWQRAGFALLPSEVEGYGQVVAEALAHGCITITTDAPPMNELIQEDRGLLVPVKTQLSYRLGTRYLISQQDLEQTVSSALELNIKTLTQKAQASSEWYLNNHREFLLRLQEQLNHLS